MSKRQSVQEWIWQSVKSSKSQSVESVKASTCQSVESITASNHQKVKALKVSKRQGAKVLKASRRQSVDSLLNASQRQRFEEPKNKNVNASKRCCQSVKARKVSKCWPLQGVEAPKRRRWPSTARSQLIMLWIGSLLLAVTAQAAAAAVTALPRSKPSKK